MKIIKIALVLVIVLMMAGSTASVAVAQQSQCGGQGGYPGSVADYRQSTGFSGSNGDWISAYAQDERNSNGEKGVKAGIPQDDGGIGEWCSPPK
jgi:pectate lyase